MDQATGLPVVSAPAGLNFMICPNCGTENRASEGLCRKCGRPLVSELGGAIPCRDHPNRRATTSCAQCGARLCDRCAVAKRGVDYCRSCAEVPEPSEEERIRKLPVVDLEAAPRAGFGTRLTAGIVDWVILVGIGLVLALLFWVFAGAPPLAFHETGRAAVARGIYWLVMALATAGYFILLTAGNGQTPGKQAMSIAVVREDGTAPGVRDCAVAFVGSIASLGVFGLGYFAMLADPAGQAWHDRWAKLLVVSLDPPAAP